MTPGAISAFQGVPFGRNRFLTCHRFQASMEKYIVRTFTSLMYLKGLQKAAVEGLGSIAFFMFIL